MHWVSSEHEMDHHCRSLLLRQCGAYLIDNGNADENGNDGHDNNRDDNESLIYIILMIFNDHDDSHEYDVNQDYDEFAVSM